MLRCGNFIENTIRKQSRSVLRRNIGEARRRPPSRRFAGASRQATRLNEMLGRENSEPDRFRDRGAIRQFQFPESTDLLGRVKDKAGAEPGDALRPDPGMRNSL